MSKPIENCPQPETPIRERAYTDRQLLELAAKAAWIHLQWIGDAPKEITTHWSGNYEEGEQLREWDWNPLTDDGDALRLAVKLGIFDRPEFFHFRSLERFGKQEANDYAATRRAIVRAAAAITKGAKS